MPEQPLFRAAALNAHRSRALGDIVLIRPLTYRLLSAAAGAMAAMVCAFLACGTYTKRSTVMGQLLPDSGLVKVYVPQLGVVRDKHVVEGQQVKKGDVLYVLSSERYSGALGSIQAAISHEVTSRRDSLRDEAAKTRLLQQEDREALVKRVESNEAELAKLDNMLEVQRTRVRLSGAAVGRYRRLLRQSYIPREQLEQKQEELLDQRARLQSMERDRIGVARELDLREKELAGLGIKNHNQMAQLERGISSVDQELAESEGKRQIHLTAPESGTITTVMAEVGQEVDSSRPLVSIVPTGARLQAHLYAPSRAVGFVRLGNLVLLRYQAYPFQKFGHARGKVTSVAKTALPTNEIASLGGSSGAGQGQQGEPVYRITVELESQTVLAYGKPQPLQAGMLLEADVLQDTRRLYEWVLEPLYSLTGKL
jgi:membrane fusion protein